MGSDQCRLVLGYRSVAGHGLHNNKDTEVKFSDFTNAGAEIVTSNIKFAMDIYNTLYWKLVYYIIIVHIVVFICWISDIYFGNTIIFIVILIFIPVSLTFLINREFVAVYLISSILRINESEFSGFRELFFRLVNGFLYLISSITYASIWPLLLLTYLDFANSPSAFWTIVACVMMICTSELAFDINKRRVFSFVATATPGKLFLQFTLTLTKLAHSAI